MDAIKHIDRNFLLEFVRVEHKFDEFTLTDPVFPRFEGLVACQTGRGCS